jgi:hypothetical protein
MLDFETYCKSKRINPEAFLKQEPTEYSYLKNYFEQVHPDSFTAQKLFAINKLRRKYLKDYSEEFASLKEETSKPLLKPAFAIKSKIQVAENKPVSAETEKEASVSPKPIIKAIARPVIKPKIPAAKTEESIDLGEKPKVIPKPLIKPKIQVKTEEKEESKETKIVEEPKISAVLKPKISPLRPKIPPKKD